MPEKARLRVHGQGGVEVELVTSYLADLKQAYESILLFQSTIDRANRVRRQIGFPLYPFEPDFAWRVGPGRIRPRSRSGLLTAEEIASATPRSEQLVLFAVSLHSPGFWEFLGTLNPLEVLRKYLNDRHERRKDRQYRESAEERRLMLENLSLETRVIADRVKLAKEMGATDRDLAPLLNELVYTPVAKLGSYQDRDIIQHAEIINPGTEDG